MPEGFQVEVKNDDWTARGPRLAGPVMAWKPNFADTYNRVILAATLGAIWGSILALAFHLLVVGQ